MRAWLTPPDIPSDHRALVVCIPDSAEFHAALSGALLLLCDDRNWEEYGIDAIDAAIAWQSVFDRFRAQECDDMTFCPVADVYQMTKPSGTNGGGAVAGLNYYSLDTIVRSANAGRVSHVIGMAGGDARLIYDRLLLTPGDYYVQWSKTAYRVSGFFPVVVIDDVATLSNPLEIAGHTGFSSTTGAEHVSMPGQALITIAENSYLWLGLRVSTTRTGDGAGRAASLASTTEIYGYVEITPL